MNEILTAPISTLLIIAGLICVVLAIIGRISGKIIIIVPPKRQLPLGGVGIVFLVIGLVLGTIIQPTLIDEGITPTPTLTPLPPPPVTVEITNPKNGAEVSSFPLIVEGTFEGELPEDWYLWLVFYNYDEWYALCPIQPFEGKWHSRLWSKPGTLGKRDIAVLLVDKDGDSEFHRYSAEEELFRILPQRTQVCDRITIEVK